MPRGRNIPNSGDFMCFSNGEWVPVSSSVASALAASVTRVVSGGVAFVYGELGYVHTDGTIRKADQAAALSAYCEAICTELLGVADGASGSFRFSPGVVSGFIGKTANTLAYVGTSGAITTTAPTFGTATWTKIVGRFISDTELNFNTDPAILPQDNA